jgi:hypothetical protein
LEATVALTTTTITATMVTMVVAVGQAASVVVDAALFGERVLVGAARALCVRSWMRMDDT